MRFKKIQHLFNTHSVAVFGECGSGKDLLMSNVACRKDRFISNCNYSVGSDKFIPLNVNALNINNNYINFISGNINKYVYPYPEGVDIFISDIQNIFPSDYDSQLCKLYPGIPSFWQLHRHIAKNNIHWNSQELIRPWKKIREHNERYILCRRSLVLFGIVFQHIRIYEKYSSAENKVLPFRFPLRMKSKDLRKLVDIERAKYINQYGVIKNHFLIYFNKSKYDSYFYKKVLEKGVWSYD